MANEGLGWDFLLKMVHNPGGDWNPGWGVDLSFIHLKGGLLVSCFFRRISEASTVSFN